MNIEAATVLAEAFSGVGQGATAAFIVWVVFDFLKASMVYICFITFFLWAYKPLVKFAKEVFDEEVKEKK